MYEQYGKRILDINLSALAIISLCVPMIIIAILIKFDSKGPAVFKQKRYGKDKNHFTIYKFRSMATTAPNNVATKSFKDSDSYITRSGRIIRKLSLDELPQLFNVLKGDMSLVGPRPVILAEKSIIMLRDQNGATRLRPGVTGLAQTNGRDELNDIRKAEYDAHYLDNISLRMDMSCIVKTAMTIIMLTGHQEGHQQSEREYALNEAS